MKKRLIAAAACEKISAVGFCRARIYTELTDRLSTESTPMVSGSIDERINPFLLMPEAKSVVVCLFSYNNGGISTNLSRYARGADYHVVVKNKLERLAGILRGEGYIAGCFCDSAPLADRHLAYLAGLGFFGRNRALINPESGSFVFIGYILTDAALPPDEPLDRTCAGCGACEKICPGGALSGGRFDALKCASYLTQKKGELSAKERGIIKKSGSAWGCDLCQSVCPHNKNVRTTEIGEFKSGLISVLSADMAESGREFKKNFSDRAFSWRGFGVIKRNLEILQEGTTLFSGAIFDVDGTILDSMLVWDNILVQYLARYGVENNGVTEKMRTITLEESMPMIAGLCGITAEEVKAEIMRLVAEEYTLRIPAKPGAAEYIRTLHENGVKIAIATSGYPNACKSAFERLGILPYISAFAFSAEVGKDKSNPDVYLLAAERIGVEPSECMVFEDILPGINGAKKAGMQTTAVADVSNQHETDELKAAADRYISDWRELI